MALEIREADLNDPEQAAAVVAIIDDYAQGPGGQMAPLCDEARMGMIAGLRAHPTTLVLLAYHDGDAVGVATCFWGFSTWAGKPLLNVHDLAVLPPYQGRGIGRQLLREVERRARERGCCKVTLEVLASNTGAQRLYVSEGFGSLGPDGMLYLSHHLD